MLPQTQPTLFRNSVSRVSGLEVHATTQLKLPFVFLNFHLLLDSSIILLTKVILTTFQKCICLINFDG